MKKILALVAAFAVVAVVGCDSPKTTPSSGKGMTPASKM